jgi:alkylation response protein AidB-like acyl-CoA dehydrogenase
VLPVASGEAAALFTEMELTRSCVEAALQAIDSNSGSDAGGDDEARDAKKIAKLAPLAKCKAGDFLHQVSNEMIQIFGGIGMTDEVDVGLYLKRARAVETLFGNQAYHRNRYTTLSGLSNFETGCQPATTSSPRAERQPSDVPPLRPET